jgi:hypothetical protein
MCAGCKVKEDSRDEKRTLLLRRRNEEDTRTSGKEGLP